MTEYICQECNYQAKYKSRWDRHILTKPHLKNISEKGYEPRTSSNHTPILLPSYTKPYKCEYCKETFTEQRNLTRHLKWCSVKNDIIKKLESDNEHLKEINVIYVNEKNKEIDHLREIYNNEIEHMREISMAYKDVKNNEIEHLNEIKNNEIAYLKEMNVTQQIEIEYLKDLLEASGLLVKKSISALSYVMKNYKDAPVLQRLEPFGIISNGYKSADKFADEMIETYKRNKLEKYIGDKIISYYKKDKTIDQSLWTTDISRCTYLIKSADNQNKWIIDKKGVNTINIIIDPIYQHLRKIILSNEYVKYDKTQKKGLNINDNGYIERMELNNKSNQLVLAIEHNKIQVETSKYISQYFCLVRTDT